MKRPFDLLTGTMFLIILILFFGSGHLLNLLHAPKWQLSAAFLGTAYLILTVIAVPKIGVIAANIAGLLGSLSLERSLIILAGSIVW